MDNGATSQLTFDTLNRTIMHHKEAKSRATSNECSLEFKNGG